MSWFLSICLNHRFQLKTVALFWARFRASISIIFRTVYSRKKADQPPLLFPLWLSLSCSIFHLLIQFFSSFHLSSPSPLFCLFFFPLFLSLSLLLFFLGLFPHSFNSFSSILLLPSYHLCSLSRYTFSKYYQHLIQKKLTTMYIHNIVEDPLDKMLTQFLSKMLSVQKSLISRKYSHQNGLKILWK